MSDRIRPSDLPYKGDRPKGIGFCKDNNGNLMWDGGDSFSGVITFPDMASFQAAGGAAAYEGPVWIGGELYHVKNKVLRSQFNQDQERRALICYDPEWQTTPQVVSGTNQPGSVSMVRGLLERWGYSYDIMFLTPSSQYFASFVNSTNGYEFIVIASGSFGYTDASAVAPILKGQARVPVFILGLNQQAAAMSGVVGLNRVTARDYRWCTHVSGGFTVPAYVSEMDALNSTVAPFIKAILTIDQPVGVPTHLPKLIGAGKRLGTVNNVYFDCGGNPNHTMLLPLLLQEAINDGKLQPPKYKATGGIDLDDTPETVMTLSDCEKLYAIQTKYNMPISWGLKLSDPEIAAMPNANWQFVASRTPDKGGLIYTVDHSGDDYWSDTNRAVIEANLLDSIAKANARGISMGWDGYDHWGYRFFNTNAIASTGLDVCAKYGIKVARFNNGIKAPRNETANWLRPISNGNSITEYKGVMCIDSFTYIDPTNDLTVSTTQEPGRTDANYGLLNYNYTWRLWQENVLPRAGGATLYMHGSNFYDGHDGGNAPGLRVLEWIGAMCQFASDVMAVVHPSEFRTEHHSKFSYVTE